jgi:hypothetical protein
MLGRATDGPGENRPKQGKFRWRPPRHWPYWLVGLGAVGLVYLAFRPRPTAVDLVTVEQGNCR